MKKKAETKNGIIVYEYVSKIRLIIILESLDKFLEEIERVEELDRISSALHKLVKE